MISIFGFEAGSHCLAQLRSLALTHSKTNDNWSLVDISCSVSIGLENIDFSVGLEDGDYSAVAVGNENRNRSEVVIYQYQALYDTFCFVLIILIWRT